MKNLLGFGVVGNFAGHLEQAGEASDFASLKRDINAPKGIFAYYVPEFINKSFLNRFCVNNELIIIPKGQKVQAEAEIALRLKLSYDEISHKITHLSPLSFMAFNDTSLRDIKTPKLSKKKNFSKACKGAGNEIAIDCFMPGGVCDDFSLVSFLNRNGEILEYGECAKLNSYGYFYEKLLVWIEDMLNFQPNEGVLENLSNLFSNYPSQIIITLGATKYIQNTQDAYLKTGDIISVIAFNHKKFNLQNLKILLKENKITPNNDISILTQKVEEL